MFSGKDLSTLSLEDLNTHYQEQGRLIAALREERDLSEKHYKEAVSGIEAKIKTNSTLIAELKNKIDSHKSILASLQKTSTPTPAAASSDGIPPPPPPPPPPSPVSQTDLSTPKAPGPIKAAVTLDPHAALLAAIRERETKKNSKNTSTTSAHNNTDTRSDTSNTPIDQSVSSTTTSPRSSTNTDDDWDSETDDYKVLTSEQAKAVFGGAFKQSSNTQPGSTKPTVASDPNKKRKQLEKDILSRDNTIHKMTSEIKDFHAKTSPTVIENMQSQQTQQLTIIEALSKQEKGLSDLSARYIETTKKKIMPTSPTSVTPPAPPPPTAFGTMPPPPPPPPPPAFGAIPPAPKKTEASATDRFVKQESKKSIDISTNTSPDTTQEHLGLLQAALAKRHAAMKGESLEDEPLQKTPEEIRLEREKAAQTLKDAQAQREQDLLAEKEASKVASKERAEILKTLPQTLGITLDLQAEPTVIGTITQKQTQDLERLKKDQVSLASFDPLLEKMELALEALSKKQAEEALAPSSVLEQKAPPEPVTPEPTLVSPVLPEPAPSSEFPSVPTDRLTQTSIADQLKTVQELFVPPTADLPTTPTAADDSLATHEEKPVETPAEFTPAAGPQSTPKSQQPEQAKPQVSETLHTFRNMFQATSIESDYQSAEKLTFAQKVHVHNHLRDEQIKLLDEIKKSLVLDDEKNDSEHAQIFYGVLQLMRENVTSEFRLTRFLGLSKHSRLEDILVKNMKKLEGQGEFKNLVKISQEDLIKLVKKEALPGVTDKIEHLLKPHGLLEKIKHFLEQGLSSNKQKPKT